MSELTSLLLLPQFLLIFRKSAAGELAEDSGLGRLALLSEIDVSSEGVKGAKSFFEAKVGRPSRRPHTAELPLFTSVSVPRSTPSTPPPASRRRSARSRSRGRRRRRSRRRGALPSRRSSRPSSDSRVPASPSALLRFQQSSAAPTTSARCYSVFHLHLITARAKQGQQAEAAEQEPFTSLLRCVLPSSVPLVSLQLTG